MKRTTGAALAEHEEESVYLRELPFYPSGFQYLESEGFEEFAKLLNEERELLDLVLLSHEALRKLWVVCIRWYFQYWVPGKPRMKTQAYLDRALDQCDVS